MPQEVMQAGHVIFVYNWLNCFLYVINTIAHFILLKNTYFLQDVLDCVYGSNCTEVF